MNVLILVALLSFVLSLIFVPCAKFVARRLQILDTPDGKIKLHKDAIPYLGGVAVFMSFVCSLFMLFSIFYDVPVYVSDIYFGCGCLLLVIIGLVDDILVLTPRQKFLGQCLACLLFLCSGCYIKFSFALYIGIAFSVLWILTIINAFNLIDVMDGLSSTVAIWASIGFMCIAIFQGNLIVASIFSSLCGALVGFLIYNYPPATIYMGDAGSLLVGGVMGALPLKLHLVGQTMAGIFAPVIILAIPLLELTSLIIIRAYKKIPFYNGSPDHFSMYLQQKGWSKTAILLYISVMMMVCVCSACGLMVDRLSMKQAIFLAIIFLIVWFIILFKKPFWAKKR